MVRILCSLFGHHRDPRRAHPSSEGWRAPCRWCGERMIRVSSRRWRVEGAPDPATRAALSMRAVRHPFGDDQAEAGSRPVADWARPNAGRQQQRDEANRARRMLGALFEHALLGGRNLNASAGGRANSPAPPFHEACASDGDRQPADWPGDADMLAIAVACCPVMSRLPGRGALQVRSTEQPQRCACNLDLH